MDRLVASGCPPVETCSFDFGPLTISGSPQLIERIAHAHCARRTVLDQLRSTRRPSGRGAARRLHRRRGRGRRRDDDGHPRHTKEGPAVTQHARGVIGADGRDSLVARTVQAEQYNERRSHLAM